MQGPDLQKLDELRSKGLRPGVVVCFYNNDHETLLFFKQEFKIWMPPQGGIKNKETPEQTIERDIHTEVGETFFRQVERNYTFFYEKGLEFHKSNQGSRDLTTDSGKEVFMKGKYYYFYAAKAYTKEVNISETEFDEYFWVNYKMAKYLVDNDKKSDKKLVLLEALDQLFKLQLIK